jgi:hypothetical protein
VADRWCDNAVGALPQPRTVDARRGGSGAAAGGEGRPRSDTWRHPIGITCDPSHVRVTLP